ncbi:MAG: hypothetical protein ACRDGM_15010, partial [bacterium]
IKAFQAWLHGIRVALVMVAIQHYEASRDLAATALHDWPFSMSLEEHQAIMAGNAAAGARALVHKTETTGRRIVKVASGAGDYPERL